MVGIKRKAALLGALALVSGCASIVEHRGYIADPVLLSSIHAGIDEIIMKPMSPRYLVERVLARLAKKKTLRPERRALRRTDWSRFGDNVVPLFRHEPAL